MQKHLLDLQLLLRPHREKFISKEITVDTTRIFRVTLDFEHGFTLIAGNRQKSAVAKMWTDDDSPLRADDVTGTAAYSNWEAKRESALERHEITREGVQAIAVEEYGSPLLTPALDAVDAMFILNRMID